MSIIFIKRNTFSSYILSRRSFSTVSISRTSPNRRHPLSVLPSWVLLLPSLSSSVNIREFKAFLARRTYPSPIGFYSNSGCHPLQAEFAELGELVDDDSVLSNEGFEIWERSTIPIFWQCLTKDRSFEIWEGLELAKGLTIPSSQ